MSYSLCLRFRRLSLIIAMCQAFISGMLNQYGGSVYAHSTVRHATSFATIRRYNSPASGNTAVTTFHNNNLRTGQNPNETLLTINNVNENQFGRRVTYPVDGQVYAQPLFVPHVMVNGKAHNVVFVATENDSVYAFDADQTTTTGGQLWYRSFIDPPAITTAPSSDLYEGMPNLDINPQVGITGTPVIDRHRGILYVVAMTRENGQYVQRLHALDITSGNEKAGSPVVIQATVPGTGAGSFNGTLSFNPARENQRPGLLLLNGVVYIAWGGFADRDPYHGWIMGYHYDGSMIRQVAVYTDTPNGEGGGIWMGGTGLSADARGNIYSSTGNGTFNLNTGGQDVGDSFIKLNTQHELSVIDYFTPFNQSCLDGRDADLGSSGILLLPYQTGTAHPHLMGGIGKEGRLYLVDRDNLGKYTVDSNLQCNTPEEKQTNFDQIVQEIPNATAESFFGIAGYYGGTSSSGQFIYTGGFNDRLKAFRLSNGLLSTTPSSSTPETFAFSGATPSISSNGNTPGSGILWVINPSNCNGTGCTPTGIGTLRAYDATDVSKELYNSEQNATRDRLDSYVKFTVPTVANGKVFVGTQTSLTIYGLLNG
jgi:hypothetical protein